ncbi:hypothetical protein QJS04_geneDACA024214 [Acorus gramineus]|uniref:Uncharacterized protein n=1 Tax=Acorus gramineus TaxID=55184 RepID=A0AAV8ZYC7_ACOGR|nr:hypothetical protein QJS04_geneDACA024214 [Acorus gramineus]
MMFWKERERESRKDRNGRADRCRFSLSAIQGLSQRRTKASLQNWSVEISTTGTFSVPLGSGGPGGLPAAKESRYDKEAVIKFFRMKRNMRTNIGLVIFPAVLCLMLYGIQRMVDSVFTATSTDTCECNCEHMPRRTGQRVSSHAR